MAGRTVTATLSLNAQGYIAGMNKAVAATQQFAAKSSAAVGKNKAGIENLSRASGLIGLGLAAGVGLAVKSAADFDSAMSSVAATGQDAKNNLVALRQAAIQAGADTKYSATEAAGGLEALAKAGVSSKDALGGGLKGALDLAAAGNLGVADSAEVAATALTQFGLSGADVPHVADLLAAGAGKAQGEVSDMAAALNQSGLVAAQFGLSIEDTTGSLAAFANAGLVGSDAGTSFKTMLQRLSNPSAEAASTMKQLGVNAYDAGGNFVGITNLAQQLKDKLGPLTQAQRNAALATIFGSDAIRSANVLYEQGGSGIQTWINNVNQTGYASDTAATKMDNLKGDLETLKGSFETALIGLGEGGNGPLRSLTQTLTNGVNAFNDLGDGAKSSLLAVGSGLAAIALGAAGVGKVAVFANEAKTALKGLGVSAKVAGIATGVVGGAVAIAGLAFGAYAQNAAESKARVEDFTTALQSQTDAIQANVTATAAKQLQENGGLEAARSLGIGLDTVTQAALGNAAAYKQVEAAVIAARAAGENSSNVDTLQRASDANVLAAAVRSTGGEYNKAVGSARQFAEATGQASGAVGVDAYAKAAGALASMGAGAAGASGSVGDLAASLFDLNNAALATSNAQIAFEAAVDGAAAAAKKNGDNLKLSSAAGRENQSALNSLASASQKYVESLVEQGASARDVVAATKSARGAFIDNATAMGLSTPAAKKLADQYGLIPKNVKTTVEVDAANSKADLAKINAAIKDLPKDEQVQIRSAYKSGGIEAAQSKLKELKDKTVTASTKGNTQGATKVSQAMKSLDGRTVTAGTKSDLSGAKKTQSGVNAVKGKSVTVKVTANTSGATEARRAIATVNGKTVTVTIRRVQKGDADGGPILTAFPRYDTGGRIRGVGGPREDNIIGVDRRTGMQTSFVSVGEYVTNAASYAANRSGIEMINAGKGRPFKVTPLADGGLAASTGVYQRADIYALLAALTNPIREIATAAADVKREQSKIAKPTAAKVKAEARYDKARDKQEDVRDKVARLQKEADATKGVTKADRDLKKARRELTKANNEVSKSSRDKTKATQAYKDVAGPLEEATNRLTEAQKSLAESARGVSSSFLEQYRSSSTDAQDWIDLMTTGAGDLKAFNEQIIALRKTGLSESLVQQVVDMGQVAGGEIAQQIITGGAGLVRSLNTANANLQSAADNLGYTSATGQVLSTSGFAPPPAAAARAASSATVADTRRVVAPTVAQSTYAPIRTTSANIDTAAVRAALADAKFFVQSPISGEYFRAFVRTEAGSVLDKETAKVGTAF